MVKVPRGYWACPKCGDFHEEKTTAYCPRCKVDRNGNREGYRNPKIEETTTATAYVPRDSIGVVYDLQGVRGRYMKVYDNRAIIGTKVTVGSFVTGNVTDGEKTIYYRDCIGVQIKQSGFLIGYLQLETAGSLMNNRHDNFFNENSFTYDPSKVSKEKMQEVADYIKSRIEEAKNAGSVQVQPAVSVADELKKFKELLDLGIITQEEFDAKKKQLLGL